jgi:fructose-1,6-bisphosphatase/inositol monophosphatase family enzyme
VADGSLDGFTTAGRSTLHGWDFMGAWLVCREAGAVMGERDDRPLDVRDGDTRRPVAAGSAELYSALRAAEL